MQTGQLIIKTDISGFTDCYADVYFEDNRIAEKRRITTSGIKLDVPLLSGEYKIVYYESEDEDDFGEVDYRKFDTRVVNYINRFDISEKTVYICAADSIKQTKSSIFSSRLKISESIKITNITSDMQNNKTYHGVCRVSGREITVTMTLIDVDKSYLHATILYEEPSNHKDCCFAYISHKGTITPQFDRFGNYLLSNQRVAMLNPEQYYFILQIK